jgi:hypothetical protein
MECVIVWFLFDWFLFGWFLFDCGLSRHGTRGAASGPHATSLGA